MANKYLCTKGTQGINPLPPPSLPGVGEFGADERPWYWLFLAITALAVAACRTLAGAAPDDLGRQRALAAALDAQAGTQLRTADTLGQRPGSPAPQQVPRVEQDAIALRAAVAGGAQLLLDLAAALLLAAGHDHAADGGQ